MVTKISILLALCFLSGVSCLNDAEIKAIVSQATTANKLIIAFENALEDISAGFDVGQFKTAFQTAIPGIKYTKDIFQFATTNLISADFKLIPVKIQFSNLNNNLNKLNDTVTEALGRLTSSSVIQQYMTHRSPVDNVEKKSASYSAAAPNDKPPLLKALQDSCKAADPHNFFIDKTVNAYLITTMSAGDKNRLMKWALIITADAARAISMHGVCTAVLNPAASYSQVEKEAEGAKVKLFKLLDDLKREMDRIQSQSGSLVAKISPHVYEMVNAKGLTDDIHNLVFDQLVKVVPNVYFAAYLLNAPYATKIFDPTRVLEISKNGRTLLVFALDYANYNQTRRDQLTAAVENVACSDPRAYSAFQTKIMDAIAEPMRQKGATAIYVTDTQLALKGHPHVSYHGRKTCHAVEEKPVRREWDYRRAIIVAY